MAMGSIAKSKEMTLADARVQLDTQEAHQSLVMTAGDT